MTHLDVVVNLKLDNLRREFHDHLSELRQIYQRSEKSDISKNKILSKLEGVMKNLVEQSEKKLTHKVMVESKKQRVMLMKEKNIKSFQDVQSVISNSNMLKEDQTMHSSKLQMGYKSQQQFEAGNQLDNRHEISKTSEGVIGRYYSNTNASGEELSIVGVSHGMSTSNFPKLLGNYEESNIRRDIQIRSSGSF